MVKVTMYLGTYKQHLAKNGTNISHCFNNEILLEPKGLNYKYQPFDYKFNCFLNT